MIYAIITHKSLTDLRSPIHAINGVADHLHVVVTVPPSLSFAEWVRNVKGRSAHEVNLSFPYPENHFGWQKSYGVLSLGQQALVNAVDYVKRQKEHHKAGTAIDALERTGDDE